MNKIDKVIWILALLVWLCILLSFVLDRINTRCYIENGYEQQIQDGKIIWVKGETE